MYEKKGALKILALVITLGLSVSALPFNVSATPWSLLVSGAELSASGDGAAEWSSETYYGGQWSIRLAALDKATWNSSLSAGEGVNEGRIVIRLAPDTTLGDVESISWWVNTTSGYPPHADLLLDLDGDGVFDGGKKDLVNGTTLSGEDDVIVAEFAYQPYDGSGFEYSDPRIPYGHYDWALQSEYYNPSYDQWVRTFQNDTLESTTRAIKNDTVCWLYSGLSGPYDGGYFGTLEDFKEGEVEIIGGTEKAPVNSGTVVLEIHIEVDNWLGPAEAYVDDVRLNGKKYISELYAPDIEVESPEHKTYGPGDIPVEIEARDIFGVDEVWFNVKKSGGDWLYDENRTYTDPTYLEDVEAGDYFIHAWANNTLGITGHTQFRFWVREGGITVEIHPETLNLKSKGRWVTIYITFPDGEDVEKKDIELEVEGGAMDPNWWRIDDDALMIKFNRSELQEKIVSTGECEITVTVYYSDGSTFEGSDTIRVISPGKQGKGPKWGDHGKQNKHQKGFNFNWNNQWKNSNKGSQNKNSKKGKGGP